jgi:recombination protein RecA
MTTLTIEDPNMGGALDDTVSIDDILAALDKDTLSMVQKGREVSNRFLPTASLGLNLIIGGLKVGAQHTFWGNEQSGKSAAMMQTVALNQRLGVPCAWIDAEHSFDPNWAARLGVDVDKLIVSQASSIADVANLSNKMIQAGVQLQVVDSTSALKPGSFFDDGELKDFSKTRQAGQFAKDLGNMCSYVQGRNWTCAVVHIAQQRTDLGNSFMPVLKAAGGMESGHTDQLRVRMFSSKSEKQAIMGQVQRGDILMEERVGRTVTWSIDKNKLNGRYGTGTYSLYTMGESVGIDRASELLAYGIKYGIISKGGAWYTVGSERIQGDTKATNYIRENKQVADELEEQIREKSV